MIDTIDLLGGVVYTVLQNREIALVLQDDGFFDIQGVNRSNTE